MEEMLQTIVRVQTELQDHLKQLNSMPESAPAPPPDQQRSQSLAVIRGVQSFMQIHAPVLAIFADPHAMGLKDAKAEAEAADVKEATAQAKAMEKVVPTAKIVPLAHAQHRLGVQQRGRAARDERLDGESAVRKSRSLRWASSGMWFKIGGSLGGQLHGQYWYERTGHSECRT